VLQKLAGVIIELLLVGALRRYRRAFWRRGIVRLWAKLVEARLDSVEARRQTIQRTTDRGRNRIDLLTQVLKIGIGQIMTIEACFDLLERRADFVEHRADRHLLGRRREGRRRWRTHWLRRLAGGRRLAWRGRLRWSRRLFLDRTLFLTWCFSWRSVLLLDRRRFGVSLSQRRRCRCERDKTDQAGKSIQQERVARPNTKYDRVTWNRAARFRL
jgi:hypothetical protein